MKDFLPESLAKKCGCALYMAKDCAWTLLVSWARIPESTLLFNDVYAVRFKVGRHLLEFTVICCVQCTPTF